MDHFPVRASTSILRYDYQRVKDKKPLSMAGPSAIGILGQHRLLSIAMIKTECPSPHLAMNPITSWLSLDSADKAAFWRYPEEFWWQYLNLGDSKNRVMCPEMGQTSMPLSAGSSSYQMDEMERKIRRMYTMVEAILILQVFFLILLFVP